MKYNLLLLLAATIVALPFKGNAQKLPCVTHSMTEAILEADPEKRAIREQLERETAEYMALPANQRAGGLKVIPTVVHVIHDNGSENISKQQILSVIDYANEELRGQNSNLSSVNAPFNSIIGDPQMELRLAKIDHQGNCTDGITRTESDLTYGAGENVKGLINWNTGTRRYLQIWLVQSVGSGAGGYTFLPGSNGAQSNGIIIRTAQFQGSLTHEFGHWMNLSHTWGPTNEPEESSNCSWDDGVSDTPNTIGTSGGCNTAQETCGSLDNVHNHMDYTSCARMFTNGQAARMQVASESGTGGRNYYWGSTNRNNTGTNDGFDAPPCVPEVSFSLDETLGCEGLEVEFDDNLFGADEDPSWVWNWSFPGGTPATSNEENPTITYNTAGVYDVTLTVSTGAGSDSYTIQDAVTVTQLGGGIDAGYQEGIENNDFPENTDSDYEWSIDSPGGLTWQRSTTASYTGDASVRINLRSITAGNVNNLISPSIDMSDVDPSDASMTFKYAHANRNSTTHDEQLRIYASRNCGETWTLRFTEDGDGLNTAGGNVTSTFVPTESQWKEEEISLVPMAGEEHVLIRFEATSDRQSYLYIDDININPNHSGVGVKEIETLNSAKIYPNPIDGTSQLELNLTESDEFNLNLVDVTGKQLVSLARNLTAGVNRISMAEFAQNLNAGFYFIQIESEKGQKTVRFVKN